MNHRITVLFALAGAASGVLIAMLCFSYSESHYGHTDIGVSVQLTLGGGIMGTLVGAGLAAVCGSRSWAAHRAIAVGVVLLAGLLSAATGWMVGDVQARNSTEHQVLIRQNTIIGAAFGPLIGLAFLIPGRRKRDGPPVTG